MSANNRISPGGQACIHSRKCQHRALPLPKSARACITLSTPGDTQAGLEYDPGPRGRIRIEEWHELTADSRDPSRRRSQAARGDPGALLSGTDHGRKDVLKVSRGHPPTLASVIAQRRFLAGPGSSSFAAPAASAWPRSDPSPRANPSDRLAAL